MIDGQFEFNVVRLDLIEKREERERDSWLDIRDENIAMR